MMGDWIRDAAAAWDRFWFTPRSGTSLGLIRLLTGAIVVYMLLAWTPLLESFFGDGGMLPPQYAQDLFDSKFAWSHLGWIESNGALWAVHLLAIAIAILYTAGIGTRITGPLVALLVISYSNRATPTLFGLDQIVAFLTLYLSFADCGSSFSLANRLWPQNQRKSVSVRNNLAIRLVQVHLCIVYLFAGLGKCQGSTWWNGEAIWGAVASHEYQTWDMTWMADHMWLVSIVTMVVLFFEVSYCALIWSKLTRPLMLLLAIPLHLGIGLCMGMLEFGLIMLIANIAFVNFPAGNPPRDSL